MFYAKNKAGKAEVSINFLIGNFTSLPFKTHEFDFAFDLGCFYHVPTEERTAYIKGVFRVLKPKATCFLVCFSYGNGVAWNHFRKAQIKKLFQDWFRIEQMDHVSSVEGDGIARCFYQVLMQRLSDDITRTGNGKMTNTSMFMLCTRLCIGEI